MVVKMMRWRPWPPLRSKKFDVKVTVSRLECDGGWDSLMGDDAVKRQGFAVEIRWKGRPKMRWRTTVKRNVTRKEGLASSDLSNGVVEWNEVFHSICSLSAYKDHSFHPWDIVFTVFHGSNVLPKNKALLVGTASLNLADYISSASEFELRLPLTVDCSSSEFCPSLCILLRLLETGHQRSVVPVLSPLRLGENSSSDKDEVSELKPRLGKAADYLSPVQSEKKASREEEDEENGYFLTCPFDSESLDDDGEWDDDGDGDVEEVDSNTYRKSFSYGTLAYANCAGGSPFYCRNDEEGGGDDDHRICLNGSSSNYETYTSENLKHKTILLPWKKRKLSFRSPKAKGELLLKKDWVEEGGDDIDFFRRQLTPPSSSPLGGHKMDGDSSAVGVSEFGDDNFAVGKWEGREITSRDGSLKLRTEVFFASIDQRSERAAGESACTVLVAVIADWLQNNWELMPIKSQFDGLIREGSLEWRNLCENEAHKERFPDRHFDLETVLQEKVRSLSVVSRKSFVGFFHPEEGLKEGGFDFLCGAMSFDDIWNDISHLGPEHSSNCETQVYIISWNDHFFILKVEPEAYYIIDTLGERLYEGCTQAYILKFDRNTTIYKTSISSPSSEEAHQRAEVEAGNQHNPKDLNKEGMIANTRKELIREEEKEVMCQGKESCKEYIKNFLAAIPIRELQADIKKGLVSPSTPIHHRLLQIEFHYTQVQPEAIETSAKNPISDVLQATSQVV